MRQAFMEGGIIMWPLLLVAVGTLGLVVHTALSLLGQTERPAEEIETALQTLLFWGTFSVVLGLLGTTIGVAQIAHAVSLAGAVEAPLVWGGVAVALPPVIFGLLIFLVCALCWVLLRYRFLRLSGAPARRGPGV